MPLVLLLVGATWGQPAGPPVPGPPLPTVPRVTAADADAAWYGVELRGWLGTPLASGDVDGDGYDDLVIDSPGESSLTRNNGAVFVVDGPAMGAALHLSVGHTPPPARGMGGGAHEGGRREATERSDLPPSPAPKGTRPYQRCTQCSPPLGSPAPAAHPDSPAPPRPAHKAETGRHAGRLRAPVADTLQRGPA